LFHFVQLLWRSFGETNLSVFFSVKISKKIWRINLNFTTASLPPGWIQEIKRMWPVLLAHGLFLTLTQNLDIYRSYITALTRQKKFVPTQPLAPCHPLFYLLGEPAFLLVVQKPIHYCPWFANNCPPFAGSSTLSHPTDKVTIFT
jgi:hypothetical protein